MSPSSIPPVVEIGNVARCRQGRLGVVYSIHVDKKATYARSVFYGIGLDGKNWSSVDPDFVANNVHDYVLQTCRELDKIASVARKV